MTLGSGSRLGPYEVLAPLGAGGMGEVYKAQDTRLDRTVAIKVLPDHLSESPERKARFEREARAISKLNHPNICALYDVGEQDGVDFLVMEHIDGETLSERLKKGALKLDQALEYAIQIANGLDAAHRAGIVHRDLKPGNVMLTASGVKLLDFGLARVLHEDEDSDTSDAPTRQQDLTKENSIIGTLQYMAPEQLEGKGADARTDVFAFGVVLYEMVTGRKAFEASSQASLIAAILEHEPAPVATLQPLSPAKLDHVLTRCLAKDPERRWQSARDLAVELEWCRETEDPSTSTSAKAGAGSKTRERVLLGLALVLGALLAWRLLAPDTEVDTTITRLEIGLPPGQELTDFLDISRDGRRLAYTAKGELGPSRLYLRSLDDFDSRVVASSEGAFAPFFSPDGEWVAFFARQKLWRVSFTGNEPVEIADAPSAMGGSWGEDGTIVFTPAQYSGLARVASSGGDVEVLTRPDNADGGYGHAWPQWLPNGRDILFSRWGSEGQLTFGAAVLSLDTGTWRMLTEENTSGARYVESGHLLYTYGPGSDLMSVPFDLSTLTVRGNPVPVLDVFYRTGRGHSPFAVSRTGTLAFNPENPAKRRLVWVDRGGVETPVVEEEDAYTNGRLSPDGKRIVYESWRQLWVLDLERGTRTRLASEGFNTNPVWSRDGERVYFGSNRSSNWSTYSKRIRGTEPAKLEHSGLVAGSMSMDGTMAATVIHPDTGFDIWTIPVGESPLPVLTSPSRERLPVFSPDGRFLAYVSDDSGRDEVFVQPYPSTGERWPVSTDGGTEPLWSPDGKELFYRRGKTVMIVEYEDSPEFAPGIPRPLFDGDYLVSDGQLHAYDISPDGERFLMIRREPESIPTRIRIVTNWTQELKRRVRPDD